MVAMCACFPSPPLPSPPFLPQRKLPPNVAPIRQDYEDFYTRRMFYRIHDCWNRPLGSAPDAYVDVLDRTPVRGQAPLTLTGASTRALNLGSYNYLGFAAHDAYCTPRVLATLESDGIAACVPRAPTAAPAPSSANWNASSPTSWAWTTPSSLAWGLPPTRPSCRAWQGRAAC